MASIAIITARGGSKRIPKKNIKEFCGKPIIAYSIEAALNSGVFDEVMVSTDSEEIASIAKKYGAEVPFMRSEATSNDFATTSDVLLEVLERYEESEKKYDIGCCLYPTAPFVTSETLLNAFDTLSQSTSKTLLPVVAFSFPPQRGVFIRKNKIVLAQPEYLNTRSQDIEKMYHDCGSFSMFRIPEFKAERKLITDDTIPFVMDEIMVQDIDNLSDWEMAELKYKMLFYQK
ncbi:pseudaminic acid cytidylyltransferase [Ruminococcus sp.]|jgi:N-acylneuraminate cytidylyltransferase|uniref:pseudaminic acid cytidylyltransferase n=1 Tax=Ruminococcus sp. TaxID=41978 RepID=UPI0025D5FB04|nr:pseudaminic acid cytidylyltransferase [Ruminococcus sp.]